jgi:hypothetical protein
VHPNLSISGSRQAQYTRFPNAVGRGAAHGVGRKEWNLLVVNAQKIINAMAAPGLYRGFKILQSHGNPILPVARDEEGLAAILGHGTRSHLT